AVPGSQADELKSCCAAAYSTDAVALLLGASYHPGGLRLTRRLADVLGLSEGRSVLDIASGPGTTARLLASEYGAAVDGVDLGEDAVRGAQEATAEAGLADRVRFLHGDAEHLPVPDAAYDALVCECAFCTFPDKATAAAEFARVLRPGGRVGITDVTLAPHGLPEELAGIAGWVACIADARPAEEYGALLRDAGLRPVRMERHDAAVGRMIDQIDARMAVLRMTAPDRLSTAGVDPGAVTPYLRAARRAVDEGVIGYTLIVAEKAVE
ncbi:SAM-dependent methyltransferase, partial [Nocardiopsis gilva]